MQARLLACRHFSLDMMAVADVNTGAVLAVSSVRKY